jgi:tRNA(fMet)-specific endonuclease VapC
MPGRYLLDTSVLIALLRGDSKVRSKLAEGGEFYTSVVALGELYYGVRRSARGEANRQQLDALASALAVLPIERLTAEVYSRLKDELRASGKPIPDNDLWIAANAQQHGLTVVDRDQHFAALTKLPRTSW